MIALNLTIGNSVEKAGKQLWGLKGSFAARLLPHMCCYLPSLLRVI